MSAYMIVVDWIAGLPRILYRGGEGQWEGVVMHYTDNPNDTARGERNYEATTFQDAFVHEFIDPIETIQVADPQYIAYGAGPYANARFIHLELCSAHSQLDFAQTFDRWCQRAAVFLSERNLGVIPAWVTGEGTLWSHADVTRFLGGTTHLDPIAYIEQWGKTWQSVIDTVQMHYDQLIEGEDKMLSVEDANKIIPFLAAAYGAAASDAAKKEFHRLANELRKASGQAAE